MQIQINTDNHIDGNEAFSAHIEAVVDNAVRHVKDHLTRVEVPHGGARSARVVVGRGERGTTSSTKLAISTRMMMPSMWMPQVIRRSKRECFVPSVAMPC
mgnify:CR=1 FL=1